MNVRGYNFDKLEEMILGYNVKRNGEVIGQETGPCQIESSEFALFDLGIMPEAGMSYEVTEVYGYLPESGDRVHLWPVE